MTLTEDEYNNEFNQLKNISIVDIVKYIKNSIDAIVAFKVEDLMDEYKSKKNENENAATDYETLLQKEEASIRQHISYENQIKIEYEKLMDKFEMVELENKLILFQLVSKKNFISFIYIGKAKRRIWKRNRKIKKRNKW